MKISLSWLQDYLTITESIEKTADILTEIGLEVEGVETFEKINGSLQGLVVGEVLSCVKHPNADRLSLTTVDIGRSKLQIVCGAPNVATGQRVAVAPVGTILFDKEGKEWKINKGKIRGEVSEGMICAEDEIGLGDSHEGILILPTDFTVGSELKDYYDTSSDTIFEIGLTPNRSDATSHLGVARDLAAALKINYQHSGQVEPPSVDAWTIDNRSRQVAVEVLSKEGCPRYCGVVISGLQIGDSPDWLKQRLSAIGVRPINNVVDATNYVLHELGQPLHAFDLDHVAGHKIKVQTLAAGTPFVSLDEQERKLHSQDLMICDGADKGMCIAGIFGGLGSGVSSGTKEIFLESAHFDAKWTRRSSER
ncbi:MAG: phenylalanine--tRNA ligase subunit beta, partial [Saprospiraceae bacterium]|nr:phenylalanine--tRNA ligase subunit beta [Saprospiraceae bacterium]